MGVCYLAVWSATLMPGRLWEADFSTIVSTALDRLQYAARNLDERQHQQTTNRVTGDQCETVSQA